MTVAGRVLLRKTKLSGFSNVSQAAGDSIFMSTKKLKTSASSTSTPSAKKQTKKTRVTPKKPDASQTKYGPAEVLSGSSNSPLSEIYKSREFKTEWANDVQFHIARNLLYLRRHRQMSQADLAKAVKTSQSAIARIESAQENITLDTLQRLIAGLNGRLEVSIHPSENPVQNGQPWWESGQPATALRIPPRLAKQLAMILMQQLDTYEQTFGVIATPTD